MEIVRGKYARRRKASSRGRTQTRTSSRVKSSKQPHVRLPSDIAQELGLPGPLIVEKTADGVLLRTSKLSWEETARQMAESDEEWIAFEVTGGGSNGNH